MADATDGNDCGWRHPLLSPIVQALLWPLEWPGWPLWRFGEALCLAGQAHGYEPERVVASVMPLYRAAAYVDWPHDWLWYVYLHRLEGHPAPPARVWGRP